MGKTNEPATSQQGNWHHASLTASVPSSVLRRFLPPSTTKQATGPANIGVDVASLPEAGRSAAPCPRSRECRHPFFSLSPCTPSGHVGSLGPKLFDSPAAGSPSRVGCRGNRIRFTMSCACFRGASGLGWPPTDRKSIRTLTDVSAGPIVPVSKRTKQSGFSVRNVNECLFQDVMKRPRKALLFCARDP